jgi:hypothetical protein
MAPADSGAAKLNDHSCPSRLFSTLKPPSLSEFKKLVTGSYIGNYPLASIVISSILIYELPGYSSLSLEQLSALQDEWYHILLSRPGVFFTKQLEKDIPLIERVNEVHSAINSEENKSYSKKSDHFAGAGANDRIWNSFSKH